MSYYEQGLAIRVGEEKAKPKKENGLISILIILGITIAVYATSPGARHYYKHGRLPE